MKSILVSALCLVASSAWATVHYVMPEYAALHYTSRNCDQIKDMGFGNTHSSMYGELLWETTCGNETYVTLKSAGDIVHTIKKVQAIPVQ